MLSDERREFEIDRHSCTIIMVSFLTGIAAAQFIWYPANLVENKEYIIPYLCFLLGMIPLAASVFGMVPILICCIGCGYLCGAAVACHIVWHATVRQFIIQLGPLLLLVPACFLDGVWSLNASLCLRSLMTRQDTRTKRLVLSSVLHMVVLDLIAIMAALVSQRFQY